MTKPIPGFMNSSRFMPAEPAAVTAESDQIPMQMHRPPLSHDLQAPHHFHAMPREQQVQAPSSAWRSPARAITRLLERPG